MIMSRISKGISGALVTLLALLYPLAVHSCHMERTYLELETAYPELVDYIYNNTNAGLGYIAYRDGGNNLTIFYYNIASLSQVDEIINAYNSFISSNDGYLSNDINTVLIDFYDEFYTFAVGRGSLDSALLIDSLELWSLDDLNEFDSMFDEIRDLSLHDIGDYEEFDIQMLADMSALETVHIHAGYLEDYEIAHDINVRYPNLSVYYSGGILGPESLTSLGSFSFISDLYSFDTQYYALQLIGDPSKVMIFSRETRELVYETNPYNQQSYYGMVWENDRTAFWVQIDGSDTDCYELVDGEWRMNPDCERPEYIVTRAEMLSD